MKATGYWTDVFTRSGTAGAEAPPTGYGDNNAKEDICETAMLYFVDPDRLKKGDGSPAGKPGNAAPLRFAAMEKIVNDWKLPEGGFTVPSGTPTTAVG